MLFFIEMFLINIKWPSFTIWGVWPHLLQHWLTKVKRGEGIMLRIMLISMFDFRYIYNIYIIYIIIYSIICNMYIMIFPIMVAHATITTIYIVVIEVSCMHLLLWAIYQNQKGIWLVLFFFFFFFLTNLDIRPKFLINR